jgi:hypothetical protein
MDSFEVSKELLKDYKYSIGDFSDNSELDLYYKKFLTMAMSDLISDDISINVLYSKLGRATTILYAECLMNKLDIATNPTISLLRNKLSIMSKGERVDV